MDLSLGLEFRYDGPSSTAVEGRREVSVEKSLVGGSLVPCLHGRALFGCALVSGEMLSLTSKGFDDSRAVSPILRYVGVGARFGFEQPLLPRLALRFSSEGLVALRPLHASIDGVALRTPGLSFPLSGSVAVVLVAFFGGSR
jgi:hypothetical protein